jgi:hypothetical protein
MPYRRPSPSKMTFKTVVEAYDDNDRTLKIWVLGAYYKGSDDYFDKGFGNWLPGDAPELDATVQKWEAEPGMDPAWVAKIVENDALCGEAAIRDGTIQEQADGTFYTPGDIHDPSGDDDY